MDAPVNVPIDDPDADTEWYTCYSWTQNNDNKSYRNDILRKHGVIAEKPPSPTPIIQEALLETQRQAHENRLENKNLDELEELEDDEDEEFLKQYR